MMPDSNSLETSYLAVHLAICHVASGGMISVFALAECLLFASNEKIAVLVVCLIFLLDLITSMTKCFPSAEVVALVIHDRYF